MPTSGSHCRLELKIERLLSTFDPNHGEEANYAMRLRELISDAGCNSARGHREQTLTPSRYTDL